MVASLQEVQLQGAAKGVLFDWKDRMNSGPVVSSGNGLTYRLLGVGERALATMADSLHTEKAG